MTDTSTLKNRSLWQQLAFIIIALFLLFIITWSFRWGVANIYSYQAKRYVLRWQNELVVTQEDISAATQWMHKARKLDPYNPTYMENHARILQRSTQLESMNVSEKNAQWQRAADLYRESLTLRPVWAYAWVALLNAKAELGEFDAEFDMALSRTIELAPWESLIQWQLAIIGFRYWPALTLVQKGQVLENFDRAMTWRPQQTKFTELAQFYGQLKPFCQRKKRDADFQEMYKRSCRLYR